MGEELFFRGMESDRDYELLADINLSSHHADSEDECYNAEQIKNTFESMLDLDIRRQVLMAFQGETPVGYSRVGWYSSTRDNRLYFQISWLREEFRSSNFWPKIIQANEKRICEIAADHERMPAQFFQAWASDHQKDWIAALKICGYTVVRRFDNMLHSLNPIPVVPLPEEFDVHPVQEDELRRIWQAQKEMNVGMFENVEEDWAEEKYAQWRDNPEHTPQLWQVAWVDGQLAGMVLSRIDAQENLEKARQRGLTEHIYVRPEWRGRGLAGALISRALFQLQKQGMHEVELGVDSENGSSAYKLYKKMGYETFYSDFWFRKPFGD